MTSGVYNRLKANLMNGVVDLEADTINVALLDSNHSFTATDNVWSDVSANEISGTGYSSGGKALSNKSVTQGSTTSFDADNVSWSSATFSASHAVIYDSTASNNLLASFDFGGSQSVDSGTFTIEWHTDGIITLA